MIGRGKRADDEFEIPWWHSNDDVEKEGGSMNPAHRREMGA